MKIQELFVNRSGDQVLTKRSIIETRKYILDLIQSSTRFVFEFDNFNLFDITVYPWFDETQGIEGVFLVNLCYGGKEVDLPRVLDCTNVKLDYIHRSYDPNVLIKFYGENVEIVKIDNKHLEDHVLVGYIWE